MKKQTKIQLLIATLVLLFVISNNSYSQQCNADFSHTYITANNILFTDLSTCSSGYSIVQWDWDFDDGQTSNLQNPTHQFSVTGTYNVELSISVDSAGYFYTCNTIQQVSVTSLPAVDFTWDNNCEAEPTQFTVLSPPTDTAAIVSWVWDFGDGGTSINMEPVYVYATAGIYTVSLTIVDTTNTSNTETKQIEIFELPIASFTPSSPGCLNNNVFFDDNSTTQSGYISEWLWDFGDGNTTTVVFPDNPDVSHNYMNAGTYSVQLTVTISGGCSNTTSHQVIINSNPVADFTFLVDCLEDPVLFNDLSTENGGSSIMSWHWNFGDTLSGTNDTSSLQNPTHLYSEPGSYNVEHVIVNLDGCSDTIVKTVTVTQPGLDFTYSGLCYGSVTFFEVDETITNVAEVVSWYWDLGDGYTSTIQNPSHLYAVASGYNVTLSIVTVDGCTREVMHNVIINQTPDVEISGNTNIANINTPIQFYGTSTTGVITDWYWEFGDGSYSFDQNPVHSYQNYGTYNITLNVTNINGCQNTDTAQINIIPPPAFPDSAAIWNIIGFNYNTPSYRYRYGIIGDTILNISSKDTSYTYSKIYSLYDSTLSAYNSTYFGATRTSDDGKVYVKLPDLPESLLYDYSKTIGDTLWFTVGGAASDGVVLFWEKDHYKVITDKDSTLLLDNQYYTQWHLQGELLQDTWVESVGSITWFGLFNPLISDITTNGDSFSLACFKQNGASLYIDNPECDKCFCYLLTELEELIFEDNKMIEVYPNPAKEMINILLLEDALKNTNIKIYNSVGQCVYSTKNQVKEEIKIDIKNWNKGMYLITIQNDSSIIGVNKFIVE